VTRWRSRLLDVWSNHLGERDAPVAARVAFHILKRSRCIVSKVRSKRQMELAFARAIFMKWV
jgi:hypothetical protein